MKKELIAVIIVVVIFFIFFAGAIFISNSGIDIHLHDTYFVFTFWSVILPALIILFFAFSLAVALTSKFRKTLFNWFLLISSTGLILLCIYTYKQYTRAQNGIRTEFKEIKKK